MSYLLDTNVISELVAPKPNAKVIAWIQQIPTTSFFLSVLTIGEIRKGIEKINDHKRKKKLLIWLEHDLQDMFEDHILPISIHVADRWGRLQCQVKRTLSAIDSLIAAIALHHDIALVTRNTDDFVGCPGLEIINPWND